MSAQRQGAGDDGAGCYVHLPFCDRICPYCDFAVVEFDRLRAERYVRAIEREVAAATPPPGHVRTIYLGGGTPSALEPAHVERVLRAVFTAFELIPGEPECTLEANPSRGHADLERWRAAGVTRLSVGVQSLDDGELHRLGRDHTAAEAAGFVLAARAAGLRDVSLDLIAGAPGQTEASFARTLEAAIALAPDHVSVYGLTIEAGTPYATWSARDPAAFPDDDAVADLLSLAHDTLERAGFRHYELSNFALPGHESAHNIGYWRQQDCVAFGLSAAGYLDGTRWRNVRDFAAYCARIEAGESARDEVERLDAAGRIGEAAMLALRTAEGIERADFRRRFNVDLDAAFGPALKKCTAAGLIEVDGSGARLTGRGRLLANSACAEFLRPELQEATSQA